MVIFTFLELWILSHWPEVKTDEYYKNNSSRAVECVLLHPPTILPIVVSEVTARLPNNSIAFCKMWHLLTSGDFNIHPSEKWSEYFRKSFLNTFERRLPHFPSPVSFWGNQGGRFGPFTMARLAETPNRARANKVMEFSHWAKGWSPHIIIYQLL